MLQNIGVELAEKQGHLHLRITPFSQQRSGNVNSK